jgi:hypothetical protein
MVCDACTTRFGSKVGMPLMLLFDLKRWAKFTTSCSSPRQEGVRLDVWRDDSQVGPLRKSETGYVGKAAKDGSEDRVVSPRCYSESLM